MKKDDVGWALRILLIFAGTLSSEGKRMVLVGIWSSGEAWWVDPRRVVLFYSILIIYNSDFHWLKHNTLIVTGCVFFLRRTVEMNCSKRWIRENIRTTVYRRSGILFYRSFWSGFRVQEGRPFHLPRRLLSGCLLCFQFIEGYVGMVYPYVHIVVVGLL